MNIFYISCILFGMSEGRRGSRGSRPSGSRPSNPSRPSKPSGSGTSGGTVNGGSSGGSGGWGGSSSNFGSGNTGWGGSKPSSSYYNFKYIPGYTTNGNKVSDSILNKPLNLYAKLFSTTTKASVLL